MKVLAAKEIQQEQKQFVDLDGQSRNMASLPVALDGGEQLIESSGRFALDHLTPSTAWPR